MACAEIIFLGTGTSIGVPAIGCDCAVCRSSDPRNKRLRSSIYIEGPDLAWVVDTGPDFRTQCLREDIRRVDAVLYTHSHIDHIAGFDDLRRFCLGRDRLLPIHATPACLEDLRRVFDYAFNGKNAYYAYVKPDPRPVSGPFSLGTTQVLPLAVQHGAVETIGYLFAFQNGRRMAYIPDCKTIEPESTDALQGIDLLVLDGLRPTAHPTHMSIAEAVRYAAEVGAKETWLTHFTCNVDHGPCEESLPRGVRLAYDGLRLLS
ncbi:MAG TPA: MBL fold metallo-hydrolase [Verrucomicrobiales bacterium]|nr:MBL fold metallo-hydrolase [Verrucomicrobiales bacterium]